jgi:L-cysteine:1D-myo-inositol 2-amino-2-deoxy-alpha-D-glucopyranoside ligase
MSKSRGNLVLVSQLRAAGVDPMAVRLVLLGHHYATPWFWSQDDLDAAVTRLAGWRAAVAAVAGTDARVTLADVRAALADDLDAPRAVAAIDKWVAAQHDPPADLILDPDAPDLIRRTADALLGVRL